MNKFLQSLRNNFAFIAAKAVDKHVDGREITRKLDEELDKQITPDKSEKIQRGPLTNLLCEMIEGLWDEDFEALQGYMLGRYKKEGE